MKYNLHTHTKYCRHATGEMEDYVLYAIESGITHLGFSDHVPRRYSDGYERGWKMKTKDVPEYLGEIDRLRKKYSDRITIYVGYEAEYYPELADSFRSDVLSMGAEYLILGEHFVCALDERDEDVNQHTIIPSDSEERLKKYVSVIVEAISTGLFTYVAHPDILGFTGDRDVYRREMRKICEASARFDVPLEVNMVGLRDKRSYPNRDFWEIAAQTQSPVTIGCDAHRSDHVYDPDTEKLARELIRELGLNYVGMAKIRFLK